MEGGSVSSFLRSLKWWKLTGMIDKTEPVFSVSDELVLQNLRAVLKEGQRDHALLSAVMLTFAFAGSIDKECLRYQSEALKSVRMRIGEPESATSEGTLGTILLLAGVEVRLFPFDTLES